MKKFVFALIALLTFTAKAEVVGKDAVSGYETVSSSDYDQYQEIFRKGTECGVILSGDGDTDLDLYVYDADDDLICKSDSRGDDESCSWVPSHTGKFRIKIVNLGTVYNRYRLTMY